MTLKIEGAVGILEVGLIDNDGVLEGVSGVGGEDPPCATTVLVDTKVIIK